MLEGFKTFAATQSLQWVGRNAGKRGGAVMAQAVDSSGYLVVSDEVGYARPTFISSTMSAVVGVCAATAGRCLGEAVDGYLGSTGATPYLLGAMASEYAKVRSELYIRKWQHSLVEGSEGETNDVVDQVRDNDDDLGPSKSKLQ